jgi:DNA-binding transcriptional LysR family regulator
VAAADAGRFQDAAVDLAVTQQAVSRRIAALEAELGVRLFTRTARGSVLTIDGQAFLPHARELLRVADRAAASVRPGRRPLRVDVLGSRIAPAALLREFHQTHPQIELDLVRLFDADTAIAAVESGAIDATFRAVAAPGRQLPGGIESVRAIDERHQLLVGPGHPLAGLAEVTVAQLAGHRIWMPGCVPGTEWTAYYDALAAEFGLSIDAIGPNFGSGALMEVIADSATVATLTAERLRLVWPADYDLRRIPVVDPVLSYPHSLVWRTDNPHPGLAALREFTATRGWTHPEAWAPGWAR